MDEYTGLIGTTIIETFDIKLLGYVCVYIYICLQIVFIFFFFFSLGLPVTGQSPINLDDRLVRERKYPPLVLNGHWLNEGEAKMINNGQTGNLGDDSNVRIESKRFSSFEISSGFSENNFKRKQDSIHDLRWAAGRRCVRV